MTRFVLNHPDVVPWRGDTDDECPLEMSQCP